MAQRFGEVRRAKHNYAHDLLYKQNVVGVGLGYKVRGGQNTGEISVIVSVTRKVPATALPPGDLVPPTLDDIKTDVVETGVLRALPARIADLGPRDRWRPIVPPGVSLGHYLITAGTFGCLVHREGEPFILSNNHVLANTNAAELWDPILQPGAADGGGPRDRIARLAEFVPLVFESEPSECTLANLTARLLNSLAQALGSHHALEPVRRTGQTNQVDAALARPLSPNQVTNEILGIGAPAGKGSSALGMKVQKAGRTTGVTQGVVTQIEATVRIDYFGPKALFENQLIASAMSEGGDSGSAVLDLEKRVVGLLFAGSPATTVFNPIESVLTALSVDIL